MGLVPHMRPAADKRKTNACKRREATSAMSLSSEDRHVEPVLCLRCFTTSKMTQATSVTLSDLYSISQRAGEWRPGNKG